MFANTITGTSKLSWLAMRGFRFLEGEGDGAPAPVEAPAAEAAPVEPNPETDWKAEARKWESRAKDNATAAQRLAEIEESNKTEAEKTAERLAAAEKRANELEAAVTRAEVAAAKGVPASLLSGSTKEELEASADALIQFRGDKGSSGLHVPAEGKSPSVEVSDEKKFVNDLFGSGA